MEMPPGEIRNQKNCPNRPRGFASGNRLSVWLSLCFEDRFLVMSQGHESRWFHESEDSTWSPSPSPVALRPTDAPGHREGLEPPGPPGRPNCPLPLLPTPCFPEAHLSPDAPVPLVRMGGQSAQAGPSRVSPSPGAPGRGDRKPRPRHLHPGPPHLPDIQCSDRS